MTVVMNTAMFEKQSVTWLMMTAYQLYTLTRYSLVTEEAHQWEKQHRYCSS